MGVRTAAAVLRLPFGPGSRTMRRALSRALRAANEGDATAMSIVVGAAQSHGTATVWEVWLRSGVPGARRWTSPVVTALQGEEVPSATLPDIVVDAAWQDWLHDPAAAVWSLLGHWNRPATDTAPDTRALSRLVLGDGTAPMEAHVLVDAALRFDHPVGECARARLTGLGDPEAVDLFCTAAVNSPEAAAFCAAHHLAPSDDVQRAVFFVRTGQSAQYRALDPDGALLALGYHSASPEERAEQRTAMVALGGIDILHVLAGRRSERTGFPNLTGQDRAYLVRRLVDQGDWERLWPLTLLMPLPEAVDMVRAFGEWRPSAQNDRRMFEALCAADPDEVRRVVDAFSATAPFGPIPPVTISLDALDERIASVDAVDFSPDGTELAFIGRGLGGKGGVAGIVDLPRRTLLRLHTGFERRLRRVVHLGAGALAVAETEHLSGVRYVDGDGVHEIDVSATKIHPKATISGMECASGDRNLVISMSDPDPDNTCHWLCASQGGGPFDDIRFPGHHTGILAAVAPNGRLVMKFAGGSPTVVDLSGEPERHPLPNPSRLRARLGIDGWCPAAASLSAIVLTSRRGDLHVWHHPPVSADPPRSARVWTSRTAPFAMSWSAALDGFVAASREGHLHLFDVPADPDTALPDNLISERIALGGYSGVYHPLRLSPAGDMTATPGPEGGIDIHLLTTVTLRSFVAEPMGRMTRKQLPAVVTLSAHPALDDDSRRTLALLRTCLEHRFRHDVELGDRTEATTPTADFEIELGRP